VNECVVEELKKLNPKRMEVVVKANAELNRCAETDDLRLKVTEATSGLARYLRRLQRWSMLVSP
jgi:hypothetical protein